MIGLINNVCEGCLSQMMKSYSQNFEDVLLWRALKDVCNGFYVDLGAQHPILDSVSKWFYLQGWKGIHVEPLKIYADLLQADRPNEEVIQAVVSETIGEQIIYAFPGTGLSTMSLDIANTHRQSRCETWEEERVPSVTLSALFEKVGNRDIHWLKIDVEGHERSAIASWGESNIRPWIVLVEATFPNSQLETYAEWEDLLVQRHYKFVYADGLNRFYIHKSRLELEKHFTYPPNYFDHFDLGDHWATYALRSEGALRESEIVAQIQFAENERGAALADAAEAHAAAEIAQTELANCEQRFQIAVSTIAHDFAGGIFAGISETKAEVLSELSLVRSEVQNATKSLNDEVMGLSRQFSAAVQQTSADIENLRSDLLKNIKNEFSASEASTQRKYDQLSTSIDVLTSGLSQTITSRTWALCVLLHPRKAGLLMQNLVTRGAAQRREPEAAFYDRVANQGRKRLHENSHIQDFDNLSISAVRLETTADMSTLSPENFLRFAYRNLLGREGDSEGFDHYLTRMAQGDSRVKVLKDIIRSAEYCRRARNSDLIGMPDDEFVEAAYRRILGRAPDVGGRGYYLGRLSAGASKAKILIDMGKSLEVRSLPAANVATRLKIEALVKRQTGLQGWFEAMRGRSAARRMAQYDFSTSSAIGRLEQHVAQEIADLRKELGKLILQPRGRQSHTSANLAERSFRPRWIPRELSQVASVNEADQPVPPEKVHPDFLETAALMKKEALFGKLTNARDGSKFLDDFVEGAYSVEDHGVGPVRWIGREAIIYLHVTGSRLVIKASGFFQSRFVTVMFNNVVLSTVQFYVEATEASIPSSHWKGQDVIVTLKCEATINPETAGINSDNRELGVLLHEIYFN